jgi:hypothetical protein
MHVSSKFLEYTCASGPESTVPRTQKLKLYRPRRFDLSFLMKGSVKFSNLLELRFRSAPWVPPPSTSCANTLVPVPLSMHEGNHETSGHVFHFKSSLSEKTQRVVCRSQWFLLDVSTYRRQPAPQYGLSWSTWLRIYRTGDDSYIKSYE